MDNDVIEAVPVLSKNTIDVFVVMVRYYGDYWSAFGTYKSLEEAQIHVTNVAGMTAWKIVKVSGLPIEVLDGEVRD